MIELSGEAWAGLLGGLGGAVVGGLISWLLQLQARASDRSAQAEDKRERQTATAHAIIYKLMAIASHYALYTRRFEAAWAEHAETGLPGEPWQFLVASAHEPDPVHFSTDEMTLLVELKMEDVFNSLLTLAEAHNQMGCISALYARKREELRRLVPPAAFVEGRMLAQPDALLPARPLMIELNSLATSMRDFASRDAADSLQTLEAAHAAFAEKLGIKWRLADPSAAPPAGG